MAATAIVDLDRCIGCGLCVDLCAYKGAIVVEKRKSKIDERICGRCGVCVGICPSLALNIKYLSSSIIMARARALLKTTKVNIVFEPRILIFLCDWLSRKGANTGDISKIQHSSNVRITKLPCIGSFDPRFVFHALLSGADGILVVGCDPKDCDYMRASENAKTRVKYSRMFLKSLGVEPERFRLELLQLSEARGRFVEIIRDSVEIIRGLGPKLKA